ncbi:hypothetical protein [Methylomicrobium sp. Wu6]|uniref:hypothetical protein n=1 Tax=Methylomicrobium sp. Wu6 TaxID=3107928 RepID=UPI002DD656C3|nr:hypothetical protein [Methylomicrobium sp. Wu6]MEC4747194.1 hypothetical protein [Methylomicrobium sp. Wu6]
MPESQTTPERGELARLHATTCLSMTQFINGRQCPKLAQMIVRQLNQLLMHPELEPVSQTREMYRQLLEHWQQIAAQLLEHRDARKSIVYH